MSVSIDRINGVLASLAIKAPCLAVAAAPVTLSGLQTVGGVALAEGNRVLVIAQTNSADNGIYDASSGSWTRSLDFDGNRDVVKGTLASVARTAGSQDLYEVTSANPVVIGTSPITFSLRYGANSRYVTTSAETAAGLTVSDDSYVYGDPRRSSTYRSGAWMNFGDVPTRIGSDRFTVPGDQSARYSRGRRVQLIGTGGINESRILNGIFGAGITTVDLINDVTGNGGLTGGVPTGLQIVSLSVGADTNTKNAFIQDTNAIGSQDFINRNIGNAAGSRLVIANYASDASAGATSDTGGVAILITGGAYASPYLPGMPPGRNVIMHTGLDIPLWFGTWDTARFFIPSENGTYTKPLLVYGAIKTTLNAEGVRLTAASDPGNAYISFRRVDETTRKGIVGFDSAGGNNNLMIKNEETGTARIIIQTVTSDITLTSATDIQLATAGVSTGFVRITNGLPNFVNDAAAAGGGVPVTGLYRNGSVVMIRVA